jgi:uncharacterized membrane protein
MAAKDKLSQPRGVSVGSGYDSDWFARFAERVARFFGTGRFLAVQSIIVAIWIAINAFAWALRWDKYPFILLNLVFSTQAAYAAPLILLAQNRQADRDKEEIERDRETNSRALAETEFLARELAAVRLSLEQKADRDDIIGPLERLSHVLEQIHGVSLEPAAEPEAESRLHTASDDYSADSSHQ